LRLIVALEGEADKGQVLVWAVPAHWRGEVEVLLCEVVKVAGIRERGEDRNKGGLLLPELVPLDALEEGVRLHLLKGQALLDISDETLKEALCVRVNLVAVRELEVILVPHDLPVCDIIAGGGEGRVAKEHFKHNHADGPEVTLLSVAGLDQDLWCDVVGGADCRVGQRPIRLLVVEHLLQWAQLRIHFQVLGEHAVARVLIQLVKVKVRVEPGAQSKICQLQVSVFVQQDVVRLDVTF